MIKAVFKFILLIFLFGFLNFERVATLGFGNLAKVMFFNTFFVSGPDILIAATPDMPGPDERAKIVILFWLQYEFNIKIFQ